MLEYVLDGNVFPFCHPAVSPRWGLSSASSAGQAGLSPPEGYSGQPEEQRLANVLGPAPPLAAGHSRRTRRGPSARGLPQPCEGSSRKDRRQRVGQDCRPLCGFWAKAENQLSRITDDHERELRKHHPVPVLR